VFGKHAKVKVVKNKVAPPFKRCEFDIMFGEGISKAGEIVDLGVEYGIIQKSGSWFSYNGQKLAQGRDAAKSMIQDNPELADELESKITEAMFAKHAQGEAPAKAAKSAADEATAKAPAQEAADENQDFDDELDDDFTLDEDM
jgi:recombination protein RecA